MSGVYNLATFSFRGIEMVGVKIGERLVELSQGYEHYKRATNRRDLFKAKHGYKMLDVLEEWEIFQEIFAAMAEYYAANQDEFSFCYDPDQVNFLPPVNLPSKIICAGSNYYDHAQEMGAAKPQKEIQEPYFFYKGGRHTIIGHRGTIRLTPRSWKTDYEAELAVIIGKEATRVPEERAMEYVAGFACSNDVSARDRMRRKNETFNYDWFSNKSNDTFAPIGPYLVPRQFVTDPQNLEIRAYLNGKRMQLTNTNKMVWHIHELVAAASSVTTLSPGDILLTGTGSGVGTVQGVEADWGEIEKVVAHINAGGGVFLKHGDEFAVEIDQIGRLENTVIRPEV